MLSHINEIKEHNNKNLTKFVDDKIKEIHIIDASVCQKIDITIKSFKDSDNDEALYQYLLLSKIIAQIGLNILQNKKYYFKINVFDFNHLLKGIYDENDRKTFTENVEKLHTGDQKTLKDTVESNIIIYLIVAKILQSNEKDRTDGKHVSLINGDGRGKTFNSLSSRLNAGHNDYHELNNEPSTICDSKWTCSFCDTANDDTATKCTVCEAEKSNARNIPDTKLSKKDRSNSEIYDVNNYKKEVLPTKKEIMELDGTSVRGDLQRNCDRCGHLYSYDGDKSSKICGDCANLLFLKEKSGEIEVDNKPLSHGDIDTPSTDQWRCVTCSDMHPMYVDKCVKCDNKWRCDKCTAMNTYDIDTCAVCGYEGPHYGKWRCDKCTVINDKSHRSCTTCYQMNPRRELCTRCDRRDINNVHSKLCDECDSADAYVNDMVNDIKNDDTPPTMSDTPRGDQWRCANCAEKWLFDVVKCAKCGNIGPHLHKWRCQQCTFYNDDWRHRCKACNICQEDRSIVYLPPITPGNNIDHARADGSRSQCMICAQFASYKLCDKCYYYYNICNNTKCNTIFDNYIEYCPHCGIKKYSRLDNCAIMECCIDGRTKKMVWQCPYMGCMNINDQYNHICDCCGCSRMTSYKTDRCIFCGWTKDRDIGYSAYTVCTKCNSTFYR